MSSVAVRSVAIMGVLTVALGVLVGCGASPRSVQAFCSTMDEHKDRYLEQMSAAQGAGLGGLVAAVSAVGDLKIMWKELSQVAPPDIQSDVEAVSDAWQKQEDNAGSMDWSAILATGLLNSGSMSRVDSYVRENCDGDYAVANAGDDAPEDAADSPEPFDPAAGPILVSCTTGSIVLQQVDLATDSVKAGWSREFTPSGETVVDPCSLSWHYGNYYVDQLFDPSMERLAITWVDPGTSKSHVGWVDDVGVITDVTAEYAGNGGFGVQPSHFNALFDIAGNFTFVDSATGLLHRVSPSSPSTDLTEPVAYSNEYGSGAMLFEPSGDPWPIGERRFNDNNTGVYTILPGGQQVTSSSGDRITDIGSDGSLVVASDEAGSMLKFLPPGSIPLGDGDPRVETEDARDVAGITPATDYAFGGAVLSPDMSMVVFSASRGDERGLFSVPVTGGEPSKILDLQPGQQLLTWRG